MNDFRVAAHPVNRGRGGDDLPQGKSHAYAIGAAKTICGFGLAPMQRFQDLSFSESPPSLRCSICDRIFRASTR